MGALIAYIATIFASNLAIVQFGVVPIGFGLMAPAGVFFAGLAFTLRDIVHEQKGPKVAMAAIVVGAVLSMAVEPALGLASGVAFLFSETADLAVYSKLRERGMVLAVAASNVVGLVVDSALFLGIAFGSMEFLAGQVVGKTYMTIIAIPFVILFRNRREAAVA